MGFDSNPFYENRALLFGTECENVNSERGITLRLLWQLLGAPGDTSFYPRCVGFQRLPIFCEKLAVHVVLEVIYQNHKQC